MIIVTPNPAIDRTMMVSRLVPGEVHRATQVIVAAGGKGLNAARAARMLGANPLCMGFLSGTAGQQLETLAAQEGLRCVWTWTAVETRTCVIVVDESGEPTVINERGPEVGAADWDALRMDVLNAAGAHARVAFCGSIPPGPQAAFTALLRDLGIAGHETWVDASGAALKSALVAVPAGIKVNLSEACTALGAHAEGVDGAAQVANDIHQRGVGQVVITLGSMGAVLCNEGGVFHAVPPQVRAVSNVGSGDSFLGGFLSALEAEKGETTALREGVATGAANTLSPGGGRFKPVDFQKILGDTRLVRLG